MASPPRSPWNARRRRQALAAAFVLWCGTPLRAQHPEPMALTQALRLAADAQESPRRPNSQDLFLEVFDDGASTGIIARVELRDGRVTARRADLRALGLALPPARATGEDERVPLDELPGLSYRYESLTQRLFLQIPTSLRPVQRLGYRPPQAADVRRDGGVLARYDVFARTNAGRYELSAGHTVRWFGSIGAIENEGVAEQGTYSRYRRLNSFWTYSDPDRLWTWTAGDLVSGGLSWTRPVRLAGLQWRRNFGVRPDLVTVPMPSFSSAAAVPSTVELYVNNVRQFGAEVQSGPFVVDTLPRISGAGQASLVITDQVGRVTETTVPLYVDHQRLATGLMDFSVEAGVLRHGLEGFRDYDTRPVASASLRRGMTDHVTFEAHAEGGAGLGVIGAGAVWAPGTRLGLLIGSTSVAAAGTRGAQYSVGYQRQGRRFGVDLQVLRRDTGFADLGDAGRGIRADTTIREQRRASVWIPARRGSVAVNWLDWTDARRERHRLASLSWQVQVGRITASASLFDDRRGGRGGGVTMTVPFGARTSASVSLRHGALGSSGVASLRRDAPFEGGWGWNVQAGDDAGADARAAVELRGRRGEARFGVYRQAGRVGSFASATGSVAMMDRRFFFSRRIDDAFAVVSTSGTAGVPVLSENRLFGVTDSRGYLLVPQLRGWQRHRLSIDPDHLDAVVRVGEVQHLAVPADRGGVLVTFGMKRVNPAIVTLLGPSGEPVPAGARVVVAGTDVRLPVGFEGEMYLEDTTQPVTLELRLGAVTCRYDLAGQPPADGASVRREVVPCKEVAP